jgi:hypothetical protein
VVLLPYLLARCLVAVWARLGERRRRQNLDDGGGGHGGRGGGGNGNGNGNELVLAA